MIQMASSKLRRGVNYTNLSLVSIIMLEPKYNTMASTSCNYG